MDTLIKIITALTIAILALLGYVYFSIFVPADVGGYPVIVEVVQGENLSSISDKLYLQKIIKNKFIFENFAKVAKQDSRIQIGEYTFKKPLNVIEIVDKLANARYEYIPVIITITEGEDSRSIADKLLSNFKNINSIYTRDELLAILQAKEGYLFPETYNYAPFATLEDVFKKIDEEFVKRTSSNNLSPNDLRRIITIASILEKEVPHPEDMKIVAGIINNRLKADMPLQMDSTLGYYTGKASLELTTEDLQSDSPYNTYKVKGLPSGPIGNPGDISIQAALNPDINEYVYFLSDKEGINHYAKTYAEHLRNRKTYLNK